MKKSALIVMLCVSQGACTHYDYGSMQTAPLLTYAELGAEITVARTPLEEESDETETLQDVVAAAP